MSTNRLLILFVVGALVVTTSFATQKVLSNANSIYNVKENALREYKLGERYGELPESPAVFSAENLQREYMLGERYGVLPEYTHQQTLREYWLGERYGQIP